MFAALSSFVPNILILGDKDKPESPIGLDGDDAEENELDPALATSYARPAKPMVDPSPIALPEHTVENKTIPRQRRAKQETPLWERYIIVRPPPAKSNHPLNLQIQLVPPRHTPARSATRHSGDFSSSDSPTPGDSTVSFNFRRSHTTTNQKMSDIIRLGTWEPVEVWSRQTDEYGRLGRPGAMASGGGQELRTELLVGGSGNASGKKFFGKCSRPSANPDSPSPSLLAPVIRSKHFRSVVPSRDNRTNSLTPRYLYHFLLAMNQASIPITLPNPVAPSVQRSAGEPVLQPPILGLQATVHPSVHQIPTGRPTTHLWILRKWAKEKQLFPEGILRGLASGFNGGSNPQVGSTASVEIRFEWTRGTSNSRKKEHKADGPRRPSTRDGVFRRAPTEEESDNVTVSSGHSKTSLPVSPSPSAHLTFPSHPSIQRRNSVGRSSEQPTATDSHEDAGEDSDIEDSETPWTCTMHIYPSNLSPLSERDAKERAAVPGSSPSVVPTPHHPKILHLVWTEPHYDFGVGARCLPRTLSSDGTIQRSAPGSIMGTEILFTAEDIKDVVASTAFWLVVREGFGGLGKIKRKGDGWHIRA
ncbi:hypothetical protein BS47DRAFT_1340621 [Hydnum rufescens UP504]|uniref:Uncharacterized protein n=1 Tax=Hydnum rufescens UP504 TaxID=1448309 RepID=A0A9P6E076_9AGAM|nr:hypothetical protein BS47DRAFT_1340621 [Hydnum rufescens UP504]